MKKKPIKAQTPFLKGFCDFEGVFGPEKWL